MKNGSEKQIKWAIDIKAKREKEINDHIIYIGSRRQIMRAAHDIRQEAHHKYGFDVKVDFGECLKMAWEHAKYNIAKLQEVMAIEDAKFWINSRFDSAIFLPNFLGRRDVAGEIDATFYSKGNRRLTVKKLISLKSIKKMSEWKEREIANGNYVTS